MKPRSESGAPTGGPAVFEIRQTDHGAPPGLIGITERQIYRISELAIDFKVSEGQTSRGDGMDAQPPGT